MLCKGERSLEENVADGTSLGVDAVCSKFVLDRPSEVTCCEGRMLCEISTPEDLETGSEVVCCSGVLHPRAKSRIALVLPVDHLETVESVCTGASVSVEWYCRAAYPG